MERKTVLTTTVWFDKEKTNAEQICKMMEEVLKVGHHRFPECEANITVGPFFPGVRSTSEMIRMIFNSDIHYASVTLNKEDKAAFKEIADLGKGDFFNGPKVADWLRKLLVRDDVRIVFGREYSPVMYVTVLNWDFKRGRRKTDKEKTGLVGEILKAAKALKVCETNVERQVPVSKEKVTNDDGNEDNYLIRLWWD